MMFEVPRFLPLVAAFLICLGVDGVSKLRLYCCEVVGKSEDRAVPGVDIFRDEFGLEADEFIEELAVHVGRASSGSFDDFKPNLSAIKSFSSNA